MPALLHVARGSPAAHTAIPIRGPNKMQNNIMGLRRAKKRANDLRHRDMQLKHQARDLGRRRISSHVHTGMISAAHGVNGASLRAPSEQEPLRRDDSRCP
mmetsp:Transcript_65688/g.174046  ORF Transcript_65688/g.174046 Transcript_65688/m.174046 type:complete len:100 (+) Transcript_65688:201-500(+)